jgi:hypothetical protein
MEHDPNDPFRFAHELYHDVDFSDVYGAKAAREAREPHDSKSMPLPMLRHGPKSAADV